MPYRIVESAAEGTGGDVTIVFPEDSEWFDGHFPDVPVLPGVAQLAAVADEIQRRLPSGHRIAGLNRVRFKQVIGPGQEVTISISKSSDNPLCHDFRITCRGTLACVGSIEMAPADGTP
jgi:3-hydroxymyristoyl/3-hydroxydecanoyl-(acyl carrier protein) dehydratase